MRCPTCDCEIPDDAVFCVFCGTKVQQALYVASNSETPPAPPAVPSTSKATNKLAIAALICAIIPFTSLVAVPLALVAVFLIDANRDTQKGMGLAVAAGMVSMLWLFILLVGGLYWANKESGGQLGSEIIEGMKYGSGLQTEPSTVFTLAPRYETMSESDFAHLTKKLQDTERILKHNLEKAHIAKSISTIYQSQTIIVRMYDLKDKQKARAILTDSKLPVRLEILSEYRWEAGPFGGIKQQQK